LKKKLDSLNENLAKVETNTVESLKLLSDLDKMKIKIETLTQSLKEAEKLAKLTQNMDTIFGSSDFKKVLPCLFPKNKQIAEDLNSMRQSLSYLKDIPEFKTKKKTLEMYQDKLEGALRPQMIQAFNTGEPSNRYSLYLTFRCMYSPL
jgi:hypothetical protein